MRSQIPFQIINKFGSDYLDCKDHGSKGTEVRYKCPKCIEYKGSPDKVGHLYVNSKSLKFTCHRCGYSGKINRYIDSDKNYSTDLYVPDDSILDEISEIYSSINDSDEFIYKIPINSASKNQSALNYLLSRGFSLDDIDYYDMRVASIYDNLFGRIIIPNKISHKVYTDMYSARSFINQTPKYKNPPDSRKTSIVFNLHRIPVGSPIIITEGVLTSIAAGKLAVAIYGKVCSSYQFSKILTNKPSKIYVNLDPDAYENSVRLCKRLYNIVDVPIIQVNMPDGTDAVDFKRDEYYRILVNSKEFIPDIRVIDKIIN